MKSLFQEDETICEVCKNKIYGARHLHHVFEGTANRKKSDEDRLVCYLHPCCHRFVHERSPMTMLTLKKRAQKAYEEKIGTREEFIKRYGRNYL